MLESGVVEASEAPVLRRHVVVVLVDRLDMATARALQYARTLAPDDLRAVHFDIDTKAARELEQEWSRLGPRLPLDIIECRDRRLGRAAIELVADATLRRRHRVHGAAAPARLRPGLAALPARPHGRQDRRRAGPGAPRERHHRPLRRRRPLRGAGALVRPVGAAGAPARSGGPDGDGSAPVDTEGRTGVDRTGRRDGQRRPGTVLAADETLAQRAGATTPIAAVVPRQRVRVAGRVKSVRVQPRAGTSNLECVLSDGTGGLLLVFQGRPKIAGIEPGARLVAEGMVGAWGRRPAMLNPSFELVQGAPSDPAEP